MSAKEEELLEEISGYLHGYLKSGKIKLNSFISKINLNISNLEQLLTIRFLLKEETVKFVKDLPFLLHHFKTTTSIQNETHFGEVRGQIDWGQTIKERLARNYKDPTIFSANESVRSYHTPENVVLKQLLLTLYSILYKDNYIKGFEKAKWFVDWNDLKGNVLDSIRKNIYLQRVDVQKVSDRMIQKTLNHRNRLYRDAAKLLLFYRSLMNGQYSKEDLEVLLRETFIAPDNVDVLFELYWVVQIIRQNTENSRLHLLDGSQNMVASWETADYSYIIYHDSTGSNDILFHVRSNEIADSNHPYLTKKYRSFTESRRLAQSIFGRKKEQFLWQGRPDILVEVYHKSTNQLDKIVIGEVKNTANIDYAITGMEELLDYIYFMKNDRANYVLDSGTMVQGILCVGDIEFEQDGEKEIVKVVKTGMEFELMV